MGTIAIEDTLEQVLPQNWVDQVRTNRCVAKQEDKGVKKE